LWLFPQREKGFRLGIAWVFEVSISRFVLNVPLISVRGHLEKVKRQKRQGTFHEQKGSSLKNALDP
jgi:hypothetical protein